MLLASVPRLHEKWRARGAGAAALAAEEDARPLEPPPLVEVEDGHLVARTE